MPLAIALLAHESSPTVSENLVPAAQARGHSVSIVDFAQSILTDFSHDPFLRLLTQADIIYYRTTGVDQAISGKLCAYLRAHRIICLNGIYDRYPHVNRKSYQAILAGESGARCPKTIADSRPTFSRISQILGAPFIAKLDISSQGRDVHLIRNESQLASIPPATSTNGYIYQEYVPHKCDYRVHMLGPKAVAAYRRIPAQGDFRANVSRGGSMEAVDDDQKEKLFAAAEELAPRFELDIFAIDFLESTRDDSLYFAEANLNPGWEASDERETGVDLTALTLDYIESRAY